MYNHNKDMIQCTGKGSKTIKQGDYSLTIRLNSQQKVMFTLDQTQAHKSNAGKESVIEKFHLFQDENSTIYKIWVIKSVIINDELINAVKHMTTYNVIRNGFTITDAKSCEQAIHYCLRNIRHHDNPPDVVMHPIYQNIACNELCEKLPRENFTDQKEDNLYLTYGFFRQNISVQHKANYDFLPIADIVFNYNDPHANNT